MLNCFVPEPQGLTRLDPPPAVIPEHCLWVDLLEPTLEAEKAVEQFLTVDVPTREGPFEEVFGSTPELMFNLMWEQHIWHGFGTLAGGVGIGYWSIDGTGVAVGGAEADDSTTMRILPLQAQLSYRFDHFRDNWPLVPVLALGIDYYAWDILGGDDEVTDFEPGQEARGGTWGWHYSVGVHLLLDFFAPEMAFDFDREAGVNSSYLTLEYQGLQVSDFGASDSFRLSDEVFMFGIALEL